MSQTLFFIFYLTLAVCYGVHLLTNYKRESTPGSASIKIPPDSTSTFETPDKTHPHQEDEQECSECKVETNIPQKCGHIFSPVTHNISNIKQIPVQRRVVIRGV